VGREEETVRVVRNCLEAEFGTGRGKGEEEKATRGRERGWKLYCDGEWISKHVV